MCSGGVLQFSWIDFLDDFHQCLAIGNGFEVDIEVMDHASATRLAG